MLLGTFERLDDYVRRRCRECGEDAAGMKPARAVITENVFPVDVAGCEPGCGCITTIHAADGTAHAEATFREVETVAYCAPESVVRVPLYMRRIDAALHNKVLKQMTHLVVHKRRHHRRTQTEALAHATGHVVLTAALPGAEVTRRAYPAVSRVES